MDDSFINQVKNKYANPGTEYDDILIAGEIKHIKSMIEEAIKQNKNSITWTYDYDNYDSYTAVVSDLYTNTTNVKEYFDKPRSVEILGNNGLGDYLIYYLNGTNANTPSRPKR